MKLTIEIGPNARIETNIPEYTLHRFIQLIGECTEEGSSFDNSIKIFASPGKISDPLADAITEAAKERSRRAKAEIPNDEDDDDDHTQRVNGSPRYSECAKSFLKRIETLDTWKYVHILEPRSIEDAVLLTAASFNTAFTLPQLIIACTHTFQLERSKLGVKNLIPLSDAKVRAVVTDNYYTGLTPMQGSLEPMYEINARGWRKCMEISQRTSDDEWLDMFHQLNHVDSKGAELHIVNI